MNGAASIMHGKTNGIDGNRIRIIAMLSAWDYYFGTWALIAANYHDRACVFGIHKR